VTAIERLELMFESGKFGLFPVSSDLDQSTAVQPARPGESFGLLAAWGRYPLVVAGALRHQGFRVHCLGINHHADPALAELCDDFQWVGAAKFGQAVRFFRRHAVRRATMAGKFHKVQIYQPWLWWRFMPDWKFVRTFYPHFITGSRDRQDDTLLGTIVAAFEAEGIHFEPATNFAPQLLVEAGLIAGRPPTKKQWLDIRFGWTIAKQIGRLDIGQCVCVKDQAVLAVEAIEGTDLCICRAGELCEQGGFTIVKVAKPQQDMRYDVPTVGLRTLESMVAARARLLAIEASRTILLDAAEFGRFANRHDLTVIVISDQGDAQRAVA
jgi:DUF1009 family protein